MSEKLNFPLMVDFKSDEDFNVPCELNNLSDFPRDIIKEESKFLKKKDLPFVSPDMKYINDDDIYKFTVLINLKYKINYYYLRIEESKYMLLSFISYFNNNDKPFLYYFHPDEYYCYYFYHENIYSIIIIENNYILYKKNMLPYIFLSEKDSIGVGSDNGKVVMNDDSILHVINPHLTYLVNSTNTNVMVETMSDLPDFESHDELFDYIKNTYFIPSQSPFQLKFVD